MEAEAPPDVRRPGGAAGPGVSGGWLLHFPGLWGGGAAGSSPESLGDGEGSGREAAPAASAGASRESGDIGDACRSPRDSDCSALSAMRLDIADLTEAVKNHDLWVQDAVVMRADIDHLHAALREHEGWMARASKKLHQMQAKDELLAGQIAGLRAASEQGTAVANSPTQSVASLPASRSPLAATVPPRSGSSPQLSAMAGAVPGAAVSEPAGSSSPLAADRSTVSHSPAMPIRTESWYGSDDEDSNEDYEAALQKVDAALARQLSCGLRMLRTVVSAVQAGLVRQLELERAARRSAVTDVRQELAMHVKEAASGWSAEGASRATVASLKSTVEALGREIGNRATEVERALAELRSEVAALRTEQHLQSVASSTLALTSAGLSRSVRQRTLRALERREVELKLQASIGAGPGQKGNSGGSNGFATLGSSMSAGGTRPAAGLVTA